MGLRRAVLLGFLGPLLVLTAQCKQKEPTADPVPKLEADVVLSEAAQKSAGIQVAPVRPASRRSSVLAAGVVEFSPSRVARVGPVVDGRIVSLKVDPGQRVKAGEMLAAMQSVQVGHARADYLAAQVRRVQADRERARQEMLADGGATSTRDLVAAQTAKELADLESRTAAERLRAVGGWAGDVDADGGGAMSSSIALTTPLAGVVLDVNARVGQPVGPSDTLFVVGEIDRVWLVVDVYERDLSKVHGGDTVHASVLAYPDRTFEGRVDYVGGIVDPVRRVVAARIVIDNPDMVLRPGMSVTARVLHEDGTGADAGVSLWVPTSAVTAVDGQPFVFVEKKPGSYELRAVERGEEVEGQVEVRRGLAAGELIVTEGTFVLKSELLKEQMGKND